jgi:hypothetical protein
LINGRSGFFREPGFYGVASQARAQKRLAEDNHDADLMAHAIDLERRALEAVKLGLSELPEEKAGEVGLVNPGIRQKENGLSRGALRPLVAHGAWGAGLHARTNSFSGLMTLVTIRRWCRCLANPCS